MRAAIKKVIALDFGRQTTTHPRENCATQDQFANLEGIAILVTKDAMSLQWAPRWLQHTGLAVKIAHSSADALDIASTTHPRLMIVDAALVADDQTPLLQTLRKMHDENVPMFALCNSAADVDIASAADVTDIVRKPFDWNLITRRAVRAIKAQDTLDKLQQAYEQVDQIHTSVTAAERERAKVAGMDTITRLPNGERFRSLMHKAISNPGNADNDLAVLVIGLDRFRMVNEAVGRRNANRLLGMFADRLRTCLASRDVIGDADGGAVTASAGRLGGAQFAMMISNAQTDEIVRVRQAIQAQLEQPFEVTGQSIYLTVSIGAAIFPHDNSNADGLLHCAENAMLEAKEAGTGFEFYTEPGDASSLRLLNLDRMLREAVANNDLELAYQPIIATDSGDVVGAEELLRWNHAEEGMISPADFVPVAEKTGLMKDIGNLVIAAACRQLHSWLDAGMQPIRMAVNLSLCQLLRGDVVTVLKKALGDYNLDPFLLEIELSERGVLNQRPEVVEEIRRLKSIGVRISIDDFGTGQAAIGYLKDLPVDVIKIDRSYISGANRDTRNEAIASGMVALAQRLNATVIVEGVETSDQLDMLRAWGSQECQGFLFSPAIAADVFLRKFG